MRKRSWKAGWWSGNTPDFCPESGGSKPSPAVFLPSSESMYFLAKGPKFPKFRANTHWNFIKSGIRRSRGTRDSAVFRDTIASDITDLIHHILNSFALEVSGASRMEIQSLVDLIFWFGDIVWKLLQFFMFVDHRIEFRTENDRNLVSFQFGKPSLINFLFPILFT